MANQAIDEWKCAVFDKRKVSQQFTKEEIALIYEFSGDFFYDYLFGSDEIIQLGANGFKIFYS